VQDGHVACVAIHQSREVQQESSEDSAALWFPANLQVTDLPWTVSYIQI
jgi:hypothetical protein